MLAQKMHTGYVAMRYGSEGFALTGYVFLGCVEDNGAWMLWGNSSAVAAAVAVAAPP